MVLKKNFKVATTQNKMKQTNLNLFLSCALAICLSSCMSTNKGYQSSPVVSRNVQLDPIKADIVVNETTKLTGKSTSTYVLGFRIKGDHTTADGINYSTDAGSSGLNLKVFKAAKLNKVRSAAAYKALATGEYDFLVHPNYTTSTKNFVGIVKIYECTVSGYGAKYQNFRTEKQKIVIIEDGKELILQDK